MIASKLKPLSLGSLIYYDGVKKGVYFRYVDDGGYSGICESCRESFGHYFGQHTKYVGFYRASGLDITLINDFLAKVTKRLGVDEMTVYAATTCEQAVIVEVTPYWRASVLRRGLFTLMLRCAALYHKRKGANIDHAIKRYGLFRSIHPAFRRFLRGKTYAPSIVNSSLVCADLKRKSATRLRAILLPEPIKS